MMIRDIAFYMTAFCEAAMFFMAFEALLERRAGRTTKQLMLCGLMLGILIMGSNYFFKTSFYNVIFMGLFALVISKGFYQESIGKCLLVVSLVQILMVLAEMLVLYGFVFVADITVQEVVVIPQYQLMGIILSKAIGFAFFHILFVRRKMKYFDFEKKYWVMFFILFMGAIFAFGAMFDMSFTLDNEKYDRLAFYSSVVLFVGMFIVLYLYEHLAQQSRALQLKEQYEQNLQSQVTHLDEMVMKQNELRRFRHDLGNQMIALEDFFERGDIEGGRTYVASMAEHFYKITSGIDTGNPAFDALISTKKSYAESKGIVFNLKVNVSDQLPIAPMDCAIIFGNALDNAIEACERLTEGSKCIRFNFMQQEHVYVCKITNPMPRNEQVHSRHKEDNLNHGLGLLNIREALKKYDTEPIIECKDGFFELKFLLYKE